MFDAPEEEHPEARPFTQWLTKDSGVKAVHSDGVQRDAQQGKTLYPLMFPRDVPMKEQLIVRVAELYTRGAEKYGDRNWEKSSASDTLGHHLEALWRHFMNFVFDVQDGEDHAAAIVWNINAVELTRRNLKAADTMRQPVSFDDSEVSEEFRQRVTEFTDKNDELLRRLEDGGVPTEVRENPVAATLRELTEKRLSDGP